MNNLTRKLMPVTKQKKGTPLQVYSSKVRTSGNKYTHVNTVTLGHKSHIGITILELGDGWLQRVRGAKPW